MDDSQLMVPFERQNAWCGPLSATDTVSQSSVEFPSDASLCDELRAVVGGLRVDLMEVRTQMLEIRVKMRSMSSALDHLLATHNAAW